MLRRMLKRFFGKEDLRSEETKHELEIMNFDDQISRVIKSIK